MPSLSDEGRRLRTSITRGPTAVDELRKRRSRRFRQRAIGTGGVLTAVGVVVAVAVSWGSPTSQHVVVPADTVPPSTASTPSGTTGCTSVDLNRPADSVMPNPVAVTAPITVGGQLIDQPAAGKTVNSVPVTASAVWAKGYLDRIPGVQGVSSGGGTNRLYLGTFMGATEAKGSAVWFLERANVALPPQHSNAVVGSSESSSTSGVGPACMFYNVVAIVDATTGQVLQVGVELANN